MKRQRPLQHGLDGTEHRGASPDTERECEDRHSSEAELGVTH